MPVVKVGCQSKDKVYLDKDKVSIFVPHQKMYVGSLLVSLRLTSLVPLSWSRVTLERLVHMVFGPLSMF